MGKLHSVDWDFDADDMMMASAPVMCKSLGKVKL